MIEFILLFFPTFITLNILKIKKEKDIKNLICEFPIYNLIINFIVFIVISLVTKENIVYFASKFNTLDFCLKYLLLAIVIATILPTFMDYFHHNFKVITEIKKETHEKNGKSEKKEKIK